MSLPVRHLPVFQNWDCQSCSNCCREYQVPVTDEERRRIEAMGWKDDPVLEGRPLFRRIGRFWKKRYILNHTDTRCVFLTDANRCRIHERFGLEAKPLACRLFPFVLMPAGDHWRVGLRFGCPSVAGNRGKPLADHADALADFAAELEHDRALDGATGSRFALQTLPPPALQLGQTVEWPDFHRFVKALQEIVLDEGERVHVRLRRCLALSRLCREARFDKVTGDRLKDFLRVVIGGIRDEVPLEAAFLPPPTPIGKLLFRQVLAIYLRKDQGPGRGSATSSRVALFRAVLQFVRGEGLVPRLHGQVSDVTFEQVEVPAGAIGPSGEEALARYYAMKIGSLQFCGPSNFGASLWDGLDGLILTYPVIRWIARAFAPLPQDEAIERALSVVDYHFGFNPLLGAGRQRLALRILVKRGELDRLIAWYSR